MADKETPVVPGTPDYYGTGGAVKGWLDQNLGSYLESNPGLYQAKAMLGGAMAGFCPSGTVVDFAGSAAPTGWVLCDGSTYDAVTNPGLYLNLWTAIGTTYGGSGQSSFIVPDCRGRTTVGLGTHVDVDTLGETEGNAVANRSYKHTMSNNATITGAPGGTFVTSVGHVDSTYQGGINAAAVLSVSGPTGSPTVGTLAVGGTIGLTSGATRPTNGPAAIVFNKIIKL